MFKLKKEQMHKCNKKCKNEAAQSNTAFTCLRYFSFSTPADIRSKISILVIYIYMMIFCIEYFQPALGFAPITKCLTKALNVQVEWESVIRVSPFKNTVFDDICIIKCVKFKRKKAKLIKTE